MYSFVLLLALIVIAAIDATAGSAAAKCLLDYGASTAAKPNKLFLLFPSETITHPSEFPAYGFNPHSPWLPLARFDPAKDLPSFEGTETELRDAIHDVVAEFYCEFKVEVISRSSPPTAADSPRRNTIGLGTDSRLRPDCKDPLRGESQREGADGNDAHPVDYARIFAGTFQACATGAGGVLNNATTDRWAWGIGSSAAHEAAHNYGLSHYDGREGLRPGENPAGTDPWSNHLMQGGAAYTWGMHTSPRHFSDHEYSVLAYNVGLAMDAMWSWDFVNPNAETAAGLTIRFLSASKAPILSAVYSGPGTPWIGPRLQGPFGTRSFKGVSYNVFEIEWSRGHEWSGGASGELPPNKPFHVGATFSSPARGTEPDPIIITDVILLDASGNALPEKPRWLGFDSGTLDPGTGSLDLRFYNFTDRALILRDVIVKELPRIMSIDAMLPNTPISDHSGRAFLPWPGGTHQPLSQVTIAPGADIRVSLASIPQTPHIYRRLTEKDCPRESKSGPGRRCEPGTIMLDLFPATTSYITAKIIDPDGKGWDAEKGRFVPAPVETQLFYQVAGRHVPLASRLSCAATESCPKPRKSTRRRTHRSR
jgi:hypothetical protein